MDRGVKFINLLRGGGGASYEIFVTSVLWASVFNEVRKIIMKV
jgi:hypothetical protein